MSRTAFQLCAMNGKDGCIFQVINYVALANCNGNAKWCQFVSPGFLFSQLLPFLFPSPTIFLCHFYFPISPIFYAISIVLSNNLLCHFWCQFLFSSLSHRCLTRKARPTRQAIDLSKSFSLSLWLSQTLSSSSPGGHFMTIAGSSTEVVGGQGLTSLAWKNWTVPG